MNAETARIIIPAIGVIFAIFSWWLSGLLSARKDIITYGVKIDHLEEAHKELQKRVEKLEDHKK